MAQLSVLIPARNEEWLNDTVADVLSHTRGDTEVIVVLDGYWPPVGLPVHERLTVLHHPESVGQRAATNHAARVSDARWIMKLDAHCAVAEGFDVRLMSTCEPDMTVIPRMYNLHVFDWLCEGCGWRDYMGPAPAACPTCGGTALRKERVWKRRLNRKADFARFDSTLHFQYWGEFGTRTEAQPEVAPTLGQIGACWMMERERFWELGGLDEEHGSWGQMGVEVSCKSWLSGGRQVVDKGTWFGHMFRTRDGFGFPYQIGQGQVDRARAHSRRLWMEHQHPFPHDLRWLLEKFAPVPDWDEAALAAIPPRTSVPVLAGTCRYAPDAQVAAAPAVQQPAMPARRTKGCAYYTDARPQPMLLRTCWHQLVDANGGMPVKAVSLGPAPWVPEAERTLVPWERGPLSMFKQILLALELLTTDYAFLTEHDVLYHPSHFLFTPERDDTVYYNQNVWKVDVADGRALHYHCNQTSGLVANRQLLVEHYRKRVERVKREGFTRQMGFEPGTRKVRHGGVDDLRYESFRSAWPNVDIRHSANLTPSRWRKEQFRNQKYTEGWTESDAVPGWGRVADWLPRLLAAQLQEA